MSKFESKRQEVIAIGKLVMKKHPDLYREMLEELQSCNPIDTDFSHISHYFNRYAEWLSTSPDDLRLPDRNRTRSMKIKVFVAAMLRIYKPELITVNGNILKYGFSIVLSNVIGRRQSNLTKIAKEVTVLERAYEEFRSEVDAVEVYLRAFYDTV
jgi:hypothetical protein